MTERGCVLVQGNDDEELQAAAIKRAREYFGWQDEQLAASTDYDKFPAQDLVSRKHERTGERYAAWITVSVVQESTSETGR